MEKLVLYSYSKCSTCRKASKWLDQKGFDYQLIDIVNEPPSKHYLKLALTKFSSDKKKVFNTRGKSFKLLNVDVTTLTNEEIIQLLLQDGKLVKRPFLAYEGKVVLLGFNEDEYRNHFLSDLKN